MKQMSWNFVFLFYFSTLLKDRIIIWRYSHDVTENNDSDGYNVTDVTDDTNERVGWNRFSGYRTLVDHRLWTSCFRKQLCGFWSRDCWSRTVFPKTERELAVAVKRRCGEDDQRHGNTNTLFTAQEGFLQHESILTTCLCEMCSESNQISLFLNMAAIFDEGLKDGGETETQTWEQPERQEERLSAGAASGEASWILSQVFRNSTNWHFSVCRA